METPIWLAVISALLGIIGTLSLMGIRDIGRRIRTLENQDEKLFSAILTLLIAKTDDHDAIARAIHALLTDGIGRPSV